jgi:hypothetical protein
VSAFAGGMYVLRVRTESGITQTRFVKRQHTQFIEFIESRYAKAWRFFYGEELPAKKVSLSSPQVCWLTSSCLV